MAPRKVRLLADLVRGLGVAEAEVRLKFNGKAAARPVLKLLNSAVANAEHNFKLQKEDLFVKTITVDGGPVMKRMVPRAMGRGMTIRKRMSHINLILSDEKPVGKKSKGKGSKAEAKDQKSEVKVAAKAKAVRKPKAVAKSEAANNA